MKTLHLALSLALLGWSGGGIHTLLAQSEQLAPELEAEVEEEEDEEELETDRDSFTPATTTVGTGFSVVESSYSFIDNRSVAETHSFPELIVRYGVSERIELRLGWNYEVGGTGDVVSGNEGGEDFLGGGLERESQALYGFKAAVTRQEAWLPQSAVILQAYTPTSGESTVTDIVAAYVAGWELTNGWRLDSSMRYGTEHGPEDAFNQWAPSVVVRAPLTEQWNAHVEYFGIFSSGAENDVSRSFISPGTHYLITSNLELGIRVGWGISNDAPNFFSNAGVGWRF
ncbi:MAG: transporter [Planctomycetaceae bacterium]